MVLGCNPRCSGKHSITHSRSAAAILPRTGKVTDTGGVTGTNKADGRRSLWDRQCPILSSPIPLPVSPLVRGAHVPVGRRWPRPSGRWLSPREQEAWWLSK